MLADYFKVFQKKIFLRIFKILCCPPFMRFQSFFENVNNVQIQIKEKKYQKLIINKKFYTIFCEFIRKN